MYDEVIKRWLEQPPEPIGHEYHFIGQRLMNGGETVAVHYRDVDERTVIITTYEHRSIAKHISGDNMMFGVHHHTAEGIFKFFEYEWEVCHRSADDLDSEANLVERSLNRFFESSIPLPPRLVRANRGVLLGGKAMALLAFHDVHVPSRFRYAMKNRALELPSSLTGGTWRHGDFLIFEKDDDAVATKMKSARATSIIDLHGTDEVEPPPYQPEAETEAIAPSFPKVRRPRFTGSGQSRMYLNDDGTYSLRDDEDVAF